MDRLKAMEAFVQVVRNGNFISAASDLGISPSIVTRRVRDLERTLGAKLLNRTTRRLNVTDVGQRYFQFSRRLLKEVREEDREIGLLQEAPYGPMKVVSSMSFGMMEMGKIVSAFMRDHPEIEISLVIGDSHRRAFETEGRDADVAIRFTVPRNTGLFTQRVGTMPWITCAAPDYLKRMGRPRAPADLKGHPCLVTNTRFGDGVWKFDGPTGATQVKVTGPVSPNNAIAMRYMVLDGAGIALLPLFCVADDIRAGRLTEILRGYCVADQPVYVFSPHAEPQPEKVRLFIDFLRHWFGKDAGARPAASA